METTKLSGFSTFSDLTSGAGRVNSPPVVGCCLENDDQARGGEKGSGREMVKFSDRPVIKVYGKPGCGLCEAAKEKFRMMGLTYESFNLADYTEYHEGWRNDRSCEIMAAYRLLEKMPVVEVDGEYLDYPSAIRRLKERLPKMEGAAAAAGN
jgi:glutaredoxin